MAPKPVTQAVPGVPMEALLVNQGPVGITLAEVAGTNPATGAYKYYAHDNIQSTRGLFEQNKAVAGTIEYTPYGENYTSPAPTGLTHRFTGLDLDATTGQYYAPYRYYAPNLSRWLTRDPLGMVDGTNVFAYLLYRPVSLADPLGLCGPDCDKLYKPEINAACGVSFLADLVVGAGLVACVLCIVICALSGFWACLGCVLVCGSGVSIGAILDRVLKPACFRALREYADCLRTYR